MQDPDEPTLLTVRFLMQTYLRPCCLINDTSMMTTTDTLSSIRGTWGRSGSPGPHTQVYRQQQRERERQCGLDSYLMDVQVGDVHCCSNSCTCPPLPQLPAYQTNLTAKCTLGPAAQCFSVETCVCQSSLVTNKLKPCGCTLFGE